MSVLTAARMSRPCAATQLLGLWYPGGVDMDLFEQSLCSVGIEQTIFSEHSLDFVWAWINLCPTEERLIGR